MSNTSQTLWPPAGISRTIVLAILVLASTLGVYVYQNSQAATEVLKSGVAGSFCLDDKGDGAVGVGSVGIYTCNGSTAQAYSFSGGEIHLGGKGCLAVQGASATSGYGQAPVVLSVCSPVPWGALWTSTSGGFTNNHASSKGTQMCLDVTGGVGHTGSETPVEIYKCTGGANQNWSAMAYGASSGGGGGTGNSSIVSQAASYIGLHEDCGKNCGTSKVSGASVNIINKNTHAAWCAYFVSYVYWKTGHQFNGGSAYNPIGYTGKVSTYDGGIATWFHNRGKFYPNTATNRANHKPQPGDFIDYDNGAHSGILRNISGSTMYSIDGNFGDAVRVDETTNWASSGTVSGWGHL